MENGKSLQFRVTYILQSCSSHELQVKKNECSLLLKFVS